MSFRLIHATALIAAELKAELQRRRDQNDPREGIVSMSVAEWARDSARGGPHLETAPGAASRCQYTEAPSADFVAFSHSEPDWSERQLRMPAPDIEGPRRPLMRGELVEWGETAPSAVSRDVSRTDEIHERVMLDMKRHGDLLVEQQRAFDLLNLPMMVLGVDPGAGDEQHTVGLEWSGLPGDPFIALQRTRGAHGTQPWDYAAGEAA